MDTLLFEGWTFFRVTSILPFANGRHDSALFFKQQARRRLEPDSGANVGHSSE
jgi:hypothetical protein